MDPAPDPSPPVGADPLIDAGRTTLAVAAGLGFVLAASADPHLNHAVDLVVIVIALVVGFVAAR